MKYFFEDEKAIARLHAAKDELIGTPFVRFSRAPGPRGGIDCVGTAEFLQARGGAVAENEFEFARTSDDYQGHGAARKILKYLLGKADDPQSARLAEIYEKIAVFRELRRLNRSKNKAGNPTVNLDVDLFMAGDILILRKEDLFHLPVMMDSRSFISAVPKLGVVEGDIHDPDYSRHLVALFRARAH